MIFTIISVVLLVIILVTIIAVINVVSTSDDKDKDKELDAEIKQIQKEEGFDEYGPCDRCKYYYNKKCKEDKKE